MSYKTSKYLANAQPIKYIKLVLKYKHSVWSMYLWITVNSVNLDLLFHNITIILSTVYVEMKVLQFEFVNIIWCYYKKTCLMVFKYAFIADTFI